MVSCRDFGPFTGPCNFSGTSSRKTDNHILASLELNQLSLRDFETGNRSSMLSWVRAASKTSVRRAFQACACAFVCVCMISPVASGRRGSHMRFSLGRVTDRLCPVKRTADHQDVGTYHERKDKGRITSKWMTPRF